MTKNKENPLVAEEEAMMTPPMVKRRKSYIPRSTSSTKSGKYQLTKFYYQRYVLFSKYDQGIQLDEDSWFSVTPENIAKHIAERIFKSLGKKEQYTIVDGMCGCGGNLIQFARTSPKVRVIGVEILKERIDMARHNAKIYGVEEQCDFILGDFCEVMKTLGPIDAVFMSPPWGGMDYIDHEKYSLSMMTPNGFDLIRQCRKHLTTNISMLLPRNVDKIELRDFIASLPDAEMSFDLEENRVGNKVKTITAYFGNLQDPESLTDSENE